MTSDALDRSPAEIESRIEQKRASLDRKLRALDYKLSPREQLHRVRDRVNADSVLGWAAVGAVATGALLAVNGWRRHHGADGHAEPADPADLEEIVMLDSAELPPEVEEPNR